ncbi:MAG: hypothetical protein ACRC5S_11450 [Cetobacterium sp.]
MYDTTINILKILYQTKISKENLSQNLNLKENSIYRAILEINILLDDLKYNTIKIKGKILEVKLTKQQWRTLFKKLDSLTFEDKVDYLYIKFIYFNSINLEKERVNLNISRSSINRCFLHVKKLMLKNGSEILSNKRKGIELIYLSEDDKKLFLLKLTKIIMEEDLLIPVQKILLNSIKNFIVKIRLSKLSAIYRCLKLSSTIMTLSYLCALDIYIERFYQNNKTLIINKEKLKIDTNLKKIYTVVSSIGYNFEKNYKKSLTYNIYNLSLNRYYYFDDTIKKSNLIIEEIFKIFGLSSNIFKKTILEYMYLGVLKKEHNILKIRNVYYHYNDKILLDFFNKLLKKYSVELYSCDKYKIIYLIKKEILNKKIKEINNILILIEEINPLYQKTLKDKLKNNFPNINFNIQCNYLNIKKDYNKDYDYIIDDSQITLGGGDIFDRVENKLQMLIIENII